MNVIRHETPIPGIEELTLRYKTDIFKGLDWTECDTRLAAYGLNELKSDEQNSITSKYLEQFKNPLIQLLLASVVISIFMGQFDDAISITLAIMIVVTVAFIQEYRSEQSLKELNKLVPPSCKAIRGGRYEEFLAKYLVPGDIVLISTGDRVPADLRMIETTNLTIDESSLTGETDACTKNSGLSSQKDYPGNSYLKRDGDENSNYSSYKPLIQDTNTSTVSIVPQNAEIMAFMGTLVQSGHGKGIVVGTGDKTQFGSVFCMMRSEEAPKSPLQVNMDELGKHLSIYSLCIIVVIVLIGWIQSRPVVEMFTIGVSLAVAAIPEGLPIVVAVTLAIGVMRMARKKAIVRHLPAVETLGCVHIICTDKTGTLTKNEMTATHLLTSELYQAGVTGVGYEFTGEVMLTDLSVDQTTQLLSIKTMAAAAFLCNNAHFDSSGRLIGQATEGALIVLAKKLHIEDTVAHYRRLDEIPFSSEQKFMAVRCRSDVAGPPLQLFVGTNYFVKGAIEVILPRCRHYHKAGTRLQFDESQKQDVLRHSEMLESQGLRVIAVAAGRSLDELMFLGAIGIFDPPRPGVKDAISILQESKIQVKMITGDSKITAQSIARMLGIMGPSGQSMSGNEIDQLMKDPSFGEAFKAERLENVCLFYRVSPQHKVTIVKMLQSIDYVVAMTGDGVNDGVALKKADIGISMGSGTDVCKEASDVILMDDDLSTIVAALEEGKGIFHNIRNFIKFQLSTSIAALTLIAMSTIMHIPNPLNAMQILYINILMDGPPAQSLGVETVDMDVLKQPPRNVKEPVLTRDLLVSIIISAAFIVCGTMLVFVSEMSDGVVTPRDTTMTFTCFVLFDLFNALSCRSQIKSIFDIGFFTNRAFLYAAGGSILGQLLVIYFPPIQRIFQTEALSLLDLLFLVGISSTVFIASELMKLFKNKMLRRKILHGTSMYLV